jgi:hypothetical protein
VVACGVPDGLDHIAVGLGLDNQVRVTLRLGHVPNHGLAPQFIVRILAANDFAAKTGNGKPFRLAGRQRTRQP